MKLPICLAAILLLTEAGAANAQVPYDCPNEPPPEYAPATFVPGEYYFRINGRATLMIGTNPYATNPDAFATLFDGIAANGSDNMVRLFVHSIPQNPAYPGAVDPGWLSQWHTVFCAAEERGLHVLVVLDVWPNWNDVANPSKWAASIYNAANNTTGEAATPAEILYPGLTQTAWLGWVRSIVDAWRGHGNILGWEIFSEIDNIIDRDRTAADQVPLPCAATPGTDLPPAVCLMEAAAAEIRAVDHLARPITASVKRVNDWPSLSEHGMDFLELHPYADFPPIDGGNLDRAIIDQVRQRRAAYGAYQKPVFIGESGLDEEFDNAPATALTVNPRGWIGINQAIWAGAVSGAMNARNLWYEDGYDTGPGGWLDLCTLSLPQYSTDARCTDGDSTTTITLHDEYADASRPVSRVIGDVDYSGFEPLTLTMGANLYGAALGNSTEAVGWVRDTLSEHNPLAADPYWPWRPLTGETVTVQVTPASVDWVVKFFNTGSGDLVSAAHVQQSGGLVTFTLPQFEGSVAFRLQAVIPTVIDIRPSQPTNIVTARRRERLPVAIFGSSELDVTTIDQTSIRFGPGRAVPASIATTNLDGDAYDDLVVVFLSRDTGIGCGVSDATLTGQTTAGRPFGDSDSVRFVGRCP